EPWRLLDLRTAGNGGGEQDTLPYRLPPVCRRPSFQSHIVPTGGRDGGCMSELILYTTEDGHSRIQLRADGRTVWLTQAEMAELFDVSTDNISLHLKNIFSDNELQAERTTEESSVVQ